MEIPSIAEHDNGSNGLGSARCRRAASPVLLSCRRHFCPAPRAACPALVPGYAVASVTSAGTGVAGGTTGASLPRR